VTYLCWAGCGILISSWSISCGCPLTLNSSLTMYYMIIYHVVRIIFSTDYFIVVVFVPTKAREYVFTGVGLFVCLSVTMITKKIVDGFVPNFMGRFLGGKGRPSSCFVTKPAIVYILYFCYNCRCGKCWRQKSPISLSREVVLSQEYFPSSWHMYLCNYYLRQHQLRG